MAAIVRVKRRIGEDPVDSLIISCKRLKQTDEHLSDKDTEELKSLFKFAATVPAQEGNIAQHIRDAIRKEKLQREYKHHNVPVDISSRARKQHRIAARRSRYQVVAHKRALQLEGLDAAEAQNRHNERQAAINALQHQNQANPAEVSDDQSGANKRKDVSDDEREAKRLFCLYDVVANADGKEYQECKGASGGAEAAPDPRSSAITCNSVPMIRERVKSVMSEYVYDLYYMNNPDFDFRSLENVLAIEARDEVEYVHSVPDHEDVYDDDEDSNEEDNWRNDYPDEDPRYYENYDVDYMYGDDGKNYSAELSSDEDVHGLSNMVTRNLRFERDGEADGYSSSEDEHLVNGADFSPQAHLSDDWVPSRGYEDYMAKVMKDLGEHHNVEENG